MQMSDLKPVNELVKKFGVKCLAFGGPGSGKTPISATAPRPVMLAVEPGLLSMQKYNISTWEAYSLPKVDDFFKWFFESKEASNFDTLAFDSISQYAEMVLSSELASNKDGRMAYGKMSMKVMELLTKLYFLQNKHIYLIAKLGTEDNMGIIKKRPYFPGQDLNIKVPHMFDEVLFADKFQFPGIVGLTPAFKTKGDLLTVARDRSGKLDEFEPTDLNVIFSKITKG